jgi:hypothetical protein
MDFSSIFIPLHSGSGCAGDKRRSLASAALRAAEPKSPEEIARTFKLDKGLGFLVRLLDTRVGTAARGADSAERTAKTLGIKPTVLLRVWGVGVLDAGEVQQHFRDRHIIVGKYGGPNPEALGPAASAQGDDLPLGFIILSHK